MYTFGLIGPLAIAACTAFELLVAVACQNCSRAIRRAIRAFLIISLVMACYSLVEEYSIARGISLPWRTIRTMMRSVRRQAVAI
jgi:hypothetical protein